MPSTLTLERKVQRVVTEEYELTISPYNVTGVQGTPSTMGKVLVTHDKHSYAHDIAKHAEHCAEDAQIIYDWISNSLPWRTMQGLYDILKERYETEQS